MNKEALHLRKILTTCRNQFTHVRDQISDRYDMEMPPIVITRLLREAIGKAIYAYLRIEQHGNHQVSRKKLFRDATDAILKGFDPLHFASLMTDMKEVNSNDWTPAEQAWIVYLEEIGKIE